MSIKPVLLILKRQGKHLVNIIIVTNQCLHLHLIGKSFILFRISHYFFFVGPSNHFQIHCFLCFIDICQETDNTFSSNSHIPSISFISELPFHQKTSFAYILMIFAVFELLFLFNEALWKCSLFQLPFETLFHLSFAQIETNYILILQSFLYCPIFISHTHLHDFGEFTILFLKSIFAIFMSFYIFPH